MYYWNCWQQFHIRLFTNKHKHKIHARRLRTCETAETLLRLYYTYYFHKIKHFQSISAKYSIIKKQNKKLYLGYFTTMYPSVVFVCKNSRKERYFYVHLNGW